MKSFTKVVIATLALGTLSSAGAALASDGTAALSALKRHEPRPVAQTERPKPRDGMRRPPVSGDIQRRDRPQPPTDKDGKRLAPPKDGQRRPPVSGDVRGKRPEPPKDKDGNPLPPPQDGKRPDGQNTKRR